MPINEKRAAQASSSTEQLPPTTVEETQRIANEQRDNPPAQDNSADAVDARRKTAETVQDTSNNYVAKIYPVGELRCSCGNVQQVTLADEDGNELKPGDVKCSNCGATPDKPMSHDEAHKDVPAWKKMRREQR